MKRTVRLLLTVLLLPAQGAAWGREGHRIIADLADRYLDPAARREVQALLDVEGAVSMADVASWGDEVRERQPETRPWHFVDIPVHPEAGPVGYDPARDCPGDHCIVTRLAAEETVLGDPHAEPHTRLEALKWVIHLVGDLHQPLHCANDHDRGGNQVRVRLFRRETNLHAVWDTALLEQAGTADLAYAIRLESLITPAEATAWREGTPSTWATESNAIARRVIYSALPHTPGQLPEDYVQQAIPTVDGQLERAGVRLADILNRTLGGRRR